MRTISRSMPPAIVSPSTGSGKAKAYRELRSTDVGTAVMRGDAWIVV